MNLINDLFDNLDKWRKLPAYQLERRSDIFFSLFMATALAEKIGEAVRPMVIPEFPVKQERSNLSDKIDYLAVRADGAELILVELKTDEKSIREKQMEYLCSAAVRGGPQICTELREIKTASKSRAKYEALEEHLLEDLGLDLADPESWPNACRVVLVKPSAKLEEKYITLFAKNRVALDIISFEEFEKTVGQYDDPLSRRFQQSLVDWS